MGMVFQNAKRDIPSAPSNIQYLPNRDIPSLSHAGPASKMPQFLYKLVLPVTVHAHRHGIIHDIILIGHRMEHLVYQALLILGWYVLEPEMIIGLGGRWRALFLLA